MKHTDIPQDAAHREPWQTTTALMTDHYELTMLQASLKAGTADRKSTRLNSSHSGESRMPSSA